MLLRKPDRWDACIYGFSGKKQGRESEQTNLDEYIEGGCNRLYVVANF